ncbi:transmembrane protein 69 [Acomys russatus]|uniref:transmembrane protein 69 n=1 Tax=Acomys russatus TaxID=60746 RepID=UPI0021E269E3|nr:transmembrane protein 69 [Acomys russatus]
MLQYPFPVRLKASRIDTLSPKTSLPQNLFPLSPRTWLSTSFQVCTRKIQCYHTSPCNFKKKQKETALPSRKPNAITYLPDSPKPALYVTLGALMPFVAPPLIMVTTKSYIPILAYAQMAYGASFLAFLGGVRWGFALPESSPAKPDYMNLATSMSPVLFSWIAILFSERLNEAIVTVILGLGIALHNELFLLPQYPNWLRALRIISTLVAFASFVVTLILTNIYPEKGPKRLSQVEI